MPELAPVLAFLDDEHVELAHRLGTFCDSELAPLPAPEDDDGARRQARELLGMMGHAGVYRPIAERDLRGCALTREALASVSSLADAVFALQALGTTPLLIADDLLRSRAQPASAAHDSHAGGPAPDNAAAGRSGSGHALASNASRNPTDAQASQTAQDLGRDAAGEDEVAGGVRSSAPGRWLDTALRGEAMAAFAMTEPDAGSDVAAISTRARRDGDAWVLNGRKTLISNAGIADFYVVFASTEPERGRRGISCFVVPADATGLEFVGPQVLSEPHPLGEIAFNECRVDADTLLGQEGVGLKIGLATLDRLRPTVAAAACGMAARALHAALVHAAGRRQFGRPLSEFQLVQEKLARMATELTAARLLVYRAAWEGDRGKDRITMEAAMAKAYATEAAQRVVDDAVQIMGGHGVLADSLVDRLYRSVRALRIYEGTTEIQHLIIAGGLIEQVGAAGGRPAHREAPNAGGRRSGSGPNITADPGSASASIGEPT